MAPQPGDHQRNKAQKVLIPPPTPPLPPAEEVSHGCKHPASKLLDQDFSVPTRLSQNLWEHPPGLYFLTKVFILQGAVSIFRFCLEGLKLISTKHVYSVGKILLEKKLTDAERSKPHGNEYTIH